MRELSHFTAMDKKKLERQGERRKRAGNVKSESGTEFPHAKKEPPLFYLLPPHNIQVSPQNAEVG
jgi:hypothetical protein